MIKRFHLNCEHMHEESQLEGWIRTVMERGFVEVHLATVGMYSIETEFFTSNTLVELTICGGFYPHGRLPPGGVFFPALKRLSLVSAPFADYIVYEHLIAGCPVLEELFLHYPDDGGPPTWCGNVVSPSIKRLTILYDFPDYPEAYGRVWFNTPSLVYLDYSGHVSGCYEANLGSLVEARLDLQPWEQLSSDTEDEDGTEDEDSTDEDDISSYYPVNDDLGDVTGLVAMINNVRTLHLSSDSLEVLHSLCQSMPLFHNLLTLSFESDKERGWQVVPLLLNCSPNLETLVIKGLVHKVTSRCGDVCPCIPKKKSKKVDEGACCLTTCQVKVLNISGYRGTCSEQKQMIHFLANLKCLETVKVGVKVDHGEDNGTSDIYTYLRITNALRKLSTVSSNCRIHIL